jgi:hypothetical protein
MSFSFYNNTKQKLSPALQMESVSIGCEAWIDVNRFYGTEKSMHHANGDFRSSGDHTPSAPAPDSLTKSFTLLRKKLRRSSLETLD